MRRALVFCANLFLFSSFLFGLEPLGYERPYSELAREFIYPTYQQLEKKVMDLPPSVLPHEVKLLRIEVGKTRFLLDFFIFAYPQYDKGDLAVSFRRNLDEGYAVLGVFKDLFDFLRIPKDKIKEEDYKPLLHKVEERRKAVFKWQEDLVRFSSRNFLQNYFENPLKEKIQNRDEKDLSSFVWKSLNPPRVLEENFQEILTRFLISSLERAENLYKKVLKIENIFDHYEQEVFFHGFRKTIRYVVKIDQYFKGFLPKALVEGESFKVLSESVDRYGRLNDLFMIEQTLLHELEGASLEEAKALMEKLEEVKKEAHAAWLALNIWQENSKVFCHIEKFKKEILGTF